MDSTPSCSSAEDVNPTQLPFVKLKCSIPPPRLRLVYILMETGGIFRRASLFSLEGFSAKSCLTWSPSPPEFLLTEIKKTLYYHQRKHKRPKPSKKYLLYFSRSMWNKLKNLHDTNFRLPVKKETFSIQEMLVSFSNANVTVLYSWCKLQWTLWSCTFTCLYTYCISHYTKNEVFHWEFLR